MRATIGRWTWSLGPRARRSTQGTHMTQQNLSTFERLAWINDDRRAVFRVATADHGDVFLSTNSHSHAVVEVEAARLLALWRRTEDVVLKPIAMGTPDSWRLDGKFAQAAQDFAHGSWNPVSLATVGLSTRGDRPALGWRRLFGAATQAPQISVAFKDGVTRTIWLLAHGATAFPVRCSLSCADALHRLAGVSGTDWYPAAQLVPDYASQAQKQADQVAATQLSRTDAR